MTFGMDTAHDIVNPFFRALKPKAILVNSILQLLGIEHRINLRDKEMCKLVYRHKNMTYRFLSGYNDSISLGP